MKTVKRFLSALCVACMMMAMFVPAFAAGGNGIQPRIDQDPFDHASLDTNPYLFSTSADYPWFRLWIRNTSSHAISGTITYADGSVKTFSVAAANPSVGYSDYTSNIINPGAGQHSVTLRGEAGNTFSGELSIHIDASAHFRMLK